MKVIVRVRPTSSKENQQIRSYEQFLQGRRKNCSKRLSPQAIAFYSKYSNANVHETVSYDHNAVSVYDQEYKNSEKKMRQFYYSQVFGSEVNNAALFDQSVREGLQGVVNGYNCTVLAYGITGSGKTYSVFGHPKLERDRGICYLAYEYLLGQKEQVEREGGQAELRFSFLEIYNENLRDLLAEDPKQQVGLGEDPRGNLQLIDAREVEVQSIEQVVELISLGSARRASAATLSNQISSRSHAILRMGVEVTRNHQRTSSKLFIIDLAGSEKINSDNFLRKTEGVNINKSLLTLGNCINALAENSKKPGLSHIPYRDSKLTRLLKDSLGGNAKIIMIACISTNPFTLEETITTLNYADRAKGIKKDLSRNIQALESECPRCHQPTTSPPETEPAYALSERMTQIEAISSSLLERLYSDIVDNARELQKLERLKSIMPENCSELKVVFSANQVQKNVLKNTLFNLLQSKTLNSKQEEEAKPQKKKIRLSNSSRRSPRNMERCSMQKENPAIFEQTQPKLFKQEGVMQSVCINNFAPDSSRHSEPRREENSDQNRTSCLSLPKKRSKVEIVKRPLPYVPKRSCSDRMMTEPICSSDLNS